MRVISLSKNSLIVACFFCLLAGLTACAIPSIQKQVKPTILSQPVQDLAALQKRLYTLQNWVLTGKVSLQYQGRIETVNLLWEQNDDHYRIVLYGPAGLGGIRIEGRPGSFKLTADRKVHEAASPEGLLADLYGWNFPVSYLIFWIKALPQPFEPFEIQLNADWGYIAHLNQANWSIDYQDYVQFGVKDPLIVPTKLKLNHASMKIIIKIQNWTIAGE